MSKVEELQDQIQNLSPEEFEQLRNWFWDLDWVAWDAQIEADVKSGKLDTRIATWGRRLPEIADGEVLDAYEANGRHSRPAEDVIAEIKKKL